MIVIVLIVSLIMMLFAGAVAAEQKTTIVFLTYQDIVKNLEKVVEEFESTHPNIVVKINGYPFEQMFEVIETKMQVKSDEIDILNVDAPLVANYSIKDYLEPLDKYFNSEEKGEFVDAALNGGSFDGQFMAAPLNSSSVGMYINVDLFKKYGVEIPSKDPAKRWTWKQVVEAAQKLTVDTNNDGQTDIWGLAFDQFSRPYQMLPLAQSLGGSGVSPDGFKSTGYITEKPWIQAAQFYQDLFNKYKISPLGMGPFQSPELFKAGKLAIILTGPWHIGNFNSVSSLNWIYVPHPYFEEGKPVTPTGSWHIGINKYSKHKEAAAEFVKFLTLKEGNVIYYKHDRNLSGNKHTLAYAKQEAEEIGDDTVLLVLFESENTAMIRPKTPGYLEWEKIVNRAFEDIRNGGNPEDVLKGAAQEIDRALEKYIQ